MPRGLLLRVNYLPIRFQIEVLHTKYDVVLALEEDVASRTAEGFADRGRFGVHCGFTGCSRVEFSIDVAHVVVRRRQRRADLAGKVW
jgi:hypothetical protein